MEENEASLPDDDEVRHLTSSVDGWYILH